MHRVFLPPEAFGQGGIVTIGGQEHRHLIRVLRLRVGDSLIVADGSGREYVARLTVIESRAALVEVVEERAVDTEPRAQVSLLMGLPKGEKLALVVQKATELGAAAIVPVQTLRSVVRPGSNGNWRRNHLQAVAEAAAAQSARGRVPLVSDPLKLPEALDRLSEESTIIMPWEGEKAQNLKGALQVLHGLERPSIALLIGPEGGWAREEVELARSRGAVTVSLGPRILRCETAAIASLTAVLYQLGDMDPLNGG